MTATCITITFDKYVKHDSFNLSYCSLLSEAFENLLPFPPPIDSVKQF